MNILTLFPCINKEKFVHRRDTLTEKSTNNRK